MELCYDLFGYKNIPEKFMPKSIPTNPVEASLSMIQGKWKILIIRDLLNGEKRFCELKKSVSGITQKVLSATLKDMEQDGILKRIEYSKIPPKVEYELTDIGYSLRPVIQALHDWGKDYKKYMKLLGKLNSEKN